MGNIKLITVSYVVVTIVCASDDVIDYLSLSFSEYLSININDAVLVLRSCEFPLTLKMKMRNGN